MKAKNRPPASDPGPRTAGIRVDLPVSRAKQRPRSSPMPHSWPSLSNDLDAPDHGSNGRILHCYELPPLRCHFCRCLVADEKEFIGLSFDVRGKRAVASPIQERLRRAGPRSFLPAQYNSFCGCLALNCANSPSEYLCHDSRRSVLSCKLL